MKRQQRKQTRRRRSSDAQQFGLSVSQPQDEKDEKTEEKTSEVSKDKRADEFRHSER